MAQALDQVEAYFSVLHAAAQPFEWRFTRHDLNALQERLAARPMAA
jgi:hypothetical protein